MNHVIFNRTINGRAYAIEVHAVGAARWRASLARRGATTSLMPFYGTTPDEAAGLLTTWLLRASQQAPPVTSGAKAKAAKVSAS